MILECGVWMPKSAQTHPFSEPTLSPKVVQRYGRID